MLEGYLVDPSTRYPRMWIKSFKKGRPTLPHSSPWWKYYVGRMLDQPFPFHLLGGNTIMEEGSFDSSMCSPILYFHFWVLFNQPFPRILLALEYSIDCNRNMPSTSWLFVYLRIGCGSGRQKWEKRRRQRTGLRILVDQWSRPLGMDSFVIFHGSEEIKLVTRHDWFGIWKVEEYKTTKMNRKDEIC